MPGEAGAVHHVHWHEWGEAGRPEALMIHCALSSGRAWAGVAEHLGRDLHMTAFDLPGHGRSASWNGERDYHALATANAAQFCATPRHVIGHSLGATIALRLALERPECVKSLVLIEPVLFAAARGTAGFDEEETAMRPFVEAMERGDHVAAARAFTGRWGGGQPWEALPEAQREYMIARIGLIPATRAVLYEDAAGLLAPGRLEALQCPVLFLEGERSPPVIGEIGAALEARMPRMRRRVIKGAGHMLPITHAPEAAWEIRTFIRV